MTFEEFQVRASEHQRRMGKDSDGKYVDPAYALSVYREAKANSGSNEFDLIIHVLEEALAKE